MASTTKNLVLTRVIATTESPKRVPYVYAGRTWYIDQAYIQSLDRDLVEAATKGADTSSFLADKHAG